MDKPLSADDADSTPEPGEPSARHPVDHVLPIDAAESDALALLGEFEQVFGALPWHAARQNTSPARRLARLRQAIHRLRPGDDVPTALCLSGGGIRSATFGLGVLQGLARIGRLERFHYLSTVSGGGYIGAWLQAWLRRAERSKVFRELKASAVGRLSEPAAARDRPAAPKPEPEAVRRLRAYSNYLSPAVGLGGDLMALVAIFVRNLFLHWLVLVPALFALLMLPRLYLALMDWTTAALSLGDAAPSTAVPGVVLGLALAAIAVALSVAYMAADLPQTLPMREPPPQAGPKNLFPLLSLLPLVLASLLFSLLVPSLTSGPALEAAASPMPRLTEHAPTSAAVAYAVGFAALHAVAAFIGSWWRARRGLQPRSSAGGWKEGVVTIAVGAIGGLALLGAMALLSSGWTPAAAPPATPLDASALARRETYAVVAMPAMMGVFWLTATLYAGLTRRSKSEDDREWWARAAGFWLLSAVGWIALFAAVLLLPRLLLAVPDALGIDAGSGSLTWGAALLGVLSSAWGYWSRNGDKIAGQVQGMFAKLNMRLLDVVSAAFVVLLAAVLGLGLSRALEWIGSEGPGVWSAVSAAKPVSASAAARTSPQGRQIDALADAEREASCARAAAAATSASAPAAAQPRKIDCPRLSSPKRAAAEFRGVLHTTGIATALVLLAGFALTAWAMAHLIGTNTFSLHSMYGNRLIRAYLGASNPREGRRPHRFTGFDPMDNVELADLAACRPFPVVNAALNLVQPSGDRLEWQQRKAASFTFTPLSCGSSVLGYAPTRFYARKPVDGEPDAAVRGLSVGRAMAISGAAASPNMGYHSSTVVAFVMSFFNVRLGWWLPNTRVPPGADAPSAWGRDEPPGAKTLLAETLARTTEHSEFIYLSDGGHFENLGLYEMVRRRCRRIVVVDASQDPLYGHEDLLSSLRKIRIDFGISISFPRGLPTSASCDRHAEPWALGHIHYGDADKGAPAGALLYLKPALWSGLPPDVRLYAETSKKSGAAFPHESTGDQFFDEAQFESYRLLGLLTVLKAFGGADRWPEGAGPDHRQPAAPPSPPAGGKATVAAAQGPSLLRRALSAAARAAARRRAGR